VRHTIGYPIERIMSERVAFGFDSDALRIPGHLLRETIGDRLLDLSSSLNSTKVPVG
jgi:hypothetical protein